MLHEDCSNWDYITHPEVKTVEGQCAVIVSACRVDPLSHEDALTDTRPFHKIIFENVAPKSCLYVAGNYRGADFDCLSQAQVIFGGRLGMPAVAVVISVEFLHTDICDAVKELDAAHVGANTTREKAILFARIVALAADVLVRFLTIHPYVNGNGHMGRLLVWILMCRYGRLPVKWTVHQSPPQYGDLLEMHRKNNKRPLEKFIMQCVIG